MMAGGRRGTAARTARPPAPPTGGGLLGQQQQGEEGGVAGTQYPQVGPWSGSSVVHSDDILCHLCDYIAAPLGRPHPRHPA